MTQRFGRVYPRSPRAPALRVPAARHLAPVTDTSISGTRVARELDTPVARRGAPMTIVSDKPLRVQSSTTTRMRKRRAAAKQSQTKSSDQR